MSNDDILDLGGFDDFELDEIQEIDIEDATKKGVRFAFIGAGQAGCNLVKGFRDDFGYRRTLFFNTTENDVVGVPEAFTVIPQGFDGAGKDRSVGLRACKQARSAIMEKMQRYFKSVDFIIVCTSTAGGTGSGATPEIIEIARNYLVQSSGISHAEACSRVGSIAVLPQRNEGKTALSNTAAFIERIRELGVVSPMFYVDNERLARMIKCSVSEWHAKSNRAIAMLWDVFNEVSAKASRFSSFDPKDYSSVLRSGIVTVGMTTMARYEASNSIANAISRNMYNTILMDGADFQGATHAGLVIVADEKSLGMLPQSDLDAAKSSVTGLMGGLGDAATSPMLHLGTYPQKSPGIRVLSIIGGFGFPESRLEEYRRYL